MTRRWTWTVLILSAFWIFYNTLFSETILYFDSFGYERLGRILCTGHFNEYLASGPTREPLYPLFICFNMKLEDFFHIPYTNLILLTQGIILLLTQGGMAWIFQRIGLGDKVSAILILYFVISPAILRSSLIVYSEIITYPLILLACVVSCETWRHLTQPSAFVGKETKRAIYMGMAFLPLMFVKAVTEVIVPAFLFIFTLTLALRWKKDLGKVKKAIIFGFIAYGVFLTPVVIYKSINKICNGNFAFTSRGSWALYGTTARRILPTTPQEKLAQKLYVFPDKSFCAQWAGVEACEHWHYALSDRLGMEKNAELNRQGLSMEEANRRLIQLSLGLMRQHPFETMKGMFWEGAKLLFWEYPSWGMVVLPREIRKVYEWPWAQGFFLFGINGLNLLFFLAAMRYAFVTKDESSVVYLWVMLLFFLLYIIAHSFFFLNERNALPIIPLYLLLIGAVIKTVQR